MSENHRSTLKTFELRAHLPQIFRVLSIIGLIVTILLVGIGFYRARNNQEFRMKSFPPELSKDVIAQVENFERTETEGDVKKYFIRADRATTFADNHQELENVFIEVFNETNPASDKISAAKAVYIPEPNKNFTAYFAGNVVIETRDALKVKTEQFTYKKEMETAEAEEAVEFERENIAGKAIGAFVNIRDKRLELMKAVEIDAFALDPNDQLAKSNLKSARLTGDYALVDQQTEKIELSENVFINLIPTGANAEMSQPTDIRTNKAVAKFTNKQIREIDLLGKVDIYQKPTTANAKWTRTKAEKAVAKIDNELKRVELIDNVEIETTSNDAKPTRINAGFAVYEKDADRFELKNGVRIVTVEDGEPTAIRSTEGVYEQSNGRIFLNGNAEIETTREFIKGDQMTAELYPNKKIKTAVSKGNAFLRQATDDRTIEVSAVELNAAFNDNQQMQKANALGASSAVLVPRIAQEYSKVTLSAPNAIRLAFRSAGLLEQMTTEGRTTILLNAPNNAEDSANKKLTADQVKTFFNAGGQDLQRAEAIGNAELLVEPLRASAQNYKTTVNAPRFDCEFFPTGNNAKLCIAQTKTKTVRVPTVAREGRGNQVLTADKLTALFDPKAQDIEQFDALGNTKFTELDRNGIAAQINFTAKDEIVRLRGNEPTVWDSRARAKADEIDWDTRNQKSFLRGNVATTYYNQKQTGGATPFTENNKPVYLTSQNAEFNHLEETGVYTGNARAWQENNYVRADRILLKQKEGQLFADGAVQSLLYDTKKKENSKEAVVPVYASSQKMFYNRETRVLRYEENVDIRQGADRVTAGIANVLLNEKNEMSKTVVENNVVITQPNRRASGDWAEYTSESEVAVLRGNPARVEDAASGSTQGAQVTVFMRENRIVNEAKTPQNNTGRIRSVYKVKKN